MKKLLLALLLTAGLYAGEVTPDYTDQDDGIIYTEKDAKGYTGDDYYVGILGSVNQSAKRTADMNFLGSGSGTEFTNVGLGLNAGIKLIEYDDIDTYFEVRMLQSFWMEESEYIATNQLAAYIKPQFTILEHINLYGLLGVGHVTYTATKSNTDFSGTGVSGGLGIQINGRHNIAYTADFVITGDDTELSIFGGPSVHSTLTVGLLYRFD